METLKTLGTPEKVKSNGQRPAARGHYAGMSQAQAVLAYLRAVKRPAKTTQIADALLAGGLVSDSPNFRSVISVLLRHMATRRQVKPLGKTGVGGRAQTVWGLPGWKKAIKVKHPASRGERTAPAERQ
jgi:hypothetical protein